MGAPGWKPGAEVFLFRDSLHLKIFKSTSLRNGGSVFPWHPSGLRQPGAPEGGNRVAVHGVEVRVLGNGKSYRQQGRHRRVLAGPLPFSRLLGDPSSVPGRLKKADWDMETGLLDWQTQRQHR